MVTTRYFLTTTSAYGREKKSRPVDRGQLNGDPYFRATDGRGTYTLLDSQPCRPHLGNPSHPASPTTDDRIACLACPLLDTYRHQNNQPN